MFTSPSQTYWTYFDSEKPINSLREPEIDILKLLYCDNNNQISQIDSRCCKY